MFPFAKKSVEHVSYIVLVLWAGEGGLDIARKKSTTASQKGAGTVVGERRNKRRNYRYGGGRGGYGISAFANLGGRVESNDDNQKYPYESSFSKSHSSEITQTR